MRLIVRFLKSISSFLDRRFPEKMTVDEVLKIHEGMKTQLLAITYKLESRVSVLESQHNAMVQSIASLKLSSGIRSAMSERE
jgi:hypothetical protein